MKSIPQSAGAPNLRKFIRRAIRPGIFAFALAAAVTGCQTQLPSTAVLPAEAGSAAGVMSLREGDTLAITFPGAPNLNTTQQIQRDGKIALPSLGEYQAAGKTASEIEKDLIKQYASELVSKQVTVTVVSASFPVYVTGSVLRPGKITSNRPISALEAIMEAGGVNPATADLKAVTVVRQEGDHTKQFRLNLNDALKGAKSQPFYLKPSDIVFVPERFNWF